jgi:hypothetical protein
MGLAPPMLQRLALFHISQVGLGHMWLECMTEGEQVCQCGGRVTLGPI